MTLEHVFRQADAFGFHRLSVLTDAGELIVMPDGSGLLDRGPDGVYSLPDLLAIARFLYGHTPFCPETGHEHMLVPIWSSYVDHIAMHGRCLTCGRAARE